MLEFEHKNAEAMLLSKASPFDSDDFLYELKLDGIRCLCYLENNLVTLHNKRLVDVSNTYPELQDIFKCCEHDCLLDGEIIVIKDGKPDFFEVQKRSLMTNPLKIKLSTANPVQFIAFDILYYNHQDLTKLPLIERKAILNKVIKEGFNLSISRYVEDFGVSLFTKTKELGLEGIVAKKKNSLYYFGKRSKDWFKIKAMEEDDFIICGVIFEETTKVVLGCFDQENKLKSFGKLYIPKTEVISFLKNFSKTNKINSPWFEGYDNVIWLNLKLVCSVSYMHRTKNSLRQPVFVCLKEDKSYLDCII